MKVDVKSYVRRPWMAVVLSVFVHPSFAMLYLGRPLRAGVYLAATIACVIAAVLLARQGLWPAGYSWLAITYLLSIVGIVDAFRLAKWRLASFSPRWFTSWKGLVGIGIALASLAVIVRTYLIEPFRSPSAAMLPTIYEGDQFFVDKLAFRHRGPLRGDVVIVRLPDGSAYVKRVIGLPGDVVVYDAASGGVTINGEQAGVESRGSYPKDPSFEVMRETIDGRSHSVVRIRGVTTVGGTYRVPDDSYFVLGDNRDNSRDSRHANFGFVPVAGIVGKVVLIWWSDADPKRSGSSVE